MSLTLTAHGRILHLNARKEGPDDDKVLACDLKLEAETDADVLVFFSPMLRAALFRAGDIMETEHGPLPTFALAFPLMGPVPWSGEMQRMELTIGGVLVPPATLKRFTIQPRIEKGLPAVTLTFSATFKPDGGEVALLAELLQDDIDIGVEPQPQLDLRPGIAGATVEVV